MRLLRRSKDTPSVVSAATAATAERRGTTSRGRGLRKWETLLLQADSAGVGVALASSVLSNAHRSPAMVFALRELDLATPNVRQQRDLAQIHALASFAGVIPSRRS